VSLKPPKPLPEFVVTDHETCGEVLATGEAYDDAEDVLIMGPFDHVVSIVGTWDDEGEPPGGAEVWNRYPARKLRLVFDDRQTSDSHGDAPTPEHVAQILVFAEDIGQGRTIVHCAAGVSRSTAACLIMVARLLGPGNEKLAVHAICDIKKMLKPHRNMVKMADALLERDGALYAEYIAAWGLK